MKKRVILITGTIIFILLVINFTLLRCFYGAKTPRGLVCHDFISDVFSGNQGIVGYLIILGVVVLSFIIAICIDSLFKK